MRIILWISLFVIYFSSGQAYDGERQSQLLDLNLQIHCQAPEGSPLEQVVIKQQAVCTKGISDCSQRILVLSVTESIAAVPSEKTEKKARCLYKKQNYVCEWGQSASLKVLLSRPQKSIEMGREQLVLRARLQLKAQQPRYPMFCKTLTVRQASVQSSVQSSMRPPSTSQVH